ncbi:MAG: type II CRISPR-associated endonuclease Cas1 [Cytophagaceae bacterium]
MIKRTLYFENPAHLSVRNAQLMVELLRDGEKETKQVPIEDIGLVVLDHRQITFTQSVITALAQQHAAILWCDEKHLPSALTWNMQGNSTFTEALRTQLEASEPLKKQLWKQTVEQKIINQAKVMDLMGYDGTPLRKMAEKVGSGDPENMEGRAASRYWDVMFRRYNVTRGQDEPMPNPFFNYAYAILRAITARSLVMSGFLPALGIHHSNKYNSFCLADDIMEPYRPIADLMVFRWLNEIPHMPYELRTGDKTTLLQLPILDVMIEGKQSPLLVGMQRTTAGLMACFEGTKRKIPYPEI